MNKLLINNWSNTKSTAFFLLGVASVFVVTNIIVSERFETFENNTRDLISKQESLLVAIAEATARNGADTVTESIVKDCALTERNTFDILLGRLDLGLSNQELIELERLFGRCGSFYSERKSVMVSRLTREIEIYDNYLSQLVAILDDEKVKEEYSIDEWYQLAAEEKKQSDLFTKLVSLQDQIIQSLLSGNSNDSTEMQTILQEVKEVQETLIVANAQATNIRKNLVSL